jgi:hypothetical protein
MASVRAARPVAEQRADDRIGVHRPIGVDVDRERQLVGLERLAGRQLE